MRPSDFFWPAGIHTEKNYTHNKEVNLFKNVIIHYLILEDTKELFHYFEEY